MTVERALRLIAGALVALSVLLGIYANANFLWFTLFVGVNLFQSAFTNWCPMMVLLRKGGLADATSPETPGLSMLGISHTAGNPSPRTDHPR